MRTAFFVTLILIWEGFGRQQDGLLFAPFSQTLGALVELAGSKDLYEALWLSNQAMLLGFLAAVVVGIPLGLVIGRLKGLERFTDPYLNVLLVTPMAALIPLIIVAVGIGLSARALVVFSFALPVITINTRTGLKNLDASLLDMARTFGAKELQLWRRVLLPGAMPAIMAGLRLGLGRALSGMVVVELLLVAVGLGELILNAMGLFEPARAYAVILVIILEATLLMEGVKWLERRALKWQPY